MHTWESIQKTLDYIETHLSEEFPIEDLAGMAALSHFYYQRLFSRLVGRPVREYTKLRRLAQAADVLKDNDKHILDIALDVGFGSHETLTRAFKEAYGMTPEQQGGQIQRNVARQTRPDPGSIFPGNLLRQLANG